MAEPFRITEPGVYPAMTSEAYFSDPCPKPSLTQSICKVLLGQSPLHAMHEHPRLKPPGDAETDEPAEKYLPAQAIGNAVHRRLINRGKDLAVGEFDDWRTKAAKEFREKAEVAGQTPILYKHMAVAHQMTTAIKLQLLGAHWDDAFVTGTGETVLCWEEDGIWFRTMIDWLSSTSRCCYDLKTTAASFAPHVIGRKMVDDGWDIQAAMHERAVHALDPENAGRWKFRFVAVENYPPYALVPVEMSETWLTLGRKKLEVAIAMWRDAIKSGQFEGYPQRPICPEYPGYAETQWLGREVEYFDGRKEDHQNERPRRDGAYLAAG